jgi:hypothetical protein
MSALRRWSARPTGSRANPRRNDREPSPLRPGGEGEIFDAVRAQTKLRARCQPSLLARCLQARFDGTERGGCHTQVGRGVIKGPSQHHTLVEQERGRTVPLRDVTDALRRNWQARLGRLSMVKTLPRP